MSTNEQLKTGDVSLSEIRINPGTAARYLGLGIAVIIGLNGIAFIPYLFMGRSHPLGPLSMDGEQNIPTTFATALLWICSVLTAAIARAERKNGWSTSLPWFVLAVSFLGMGIDETIEFHERFTEPLRAIYNTTGLLHFAWIIPYSVFTVFFALVYVRFLFDLPSDTRKYIILAAVLYITGSIGFELLGGARIASYGRDPVYYLLALVEEVLEMTGCSVFIYGFLNHIDRHLPGFRVRISSS